MADTCFIACATTREHVHANIAKPMLHTNDGSLYNYNAAMTFIIGVHHIFRKTYNSGDPGNGMDKLCIASNAITHITSIAVATAKPYLMNLNDSPLPQAQDKPAS